MEWMLMPYRRYAEFSGRSRRKEYWMFFLLSVIVAAIAYALMGLGGGADLVVAAGADPTATGEPDLTSVSWGPTFWIGLVLLCLWGLASVIPSIALTIRRLHDRNMTGWYLLGFLIVAAILAQISVWLYYILVIGWYVLMALPGTPGPNKYGPDPLGQADPEVFA